MKTLAELKRYLQVGAELYMTWHILNEQGVFKYELPWLRQVSKVQTNGVWLVDPGNEATKPSFFEFPKANAIDFKGHDVLVYENSPEDSERLHILTYWIPAVCVSCGTTVREGMCNYAGDD